MDFKNSYLCTPNLASLQVMLNTMVGIAQLVRASDCDSEGRGFEPHHSPTMSRDQYSGNFFLLRNLFKTRIVIGAALFNVDSLYVKVQLAKKPLI